MQHLPRMTSLQARLSHQAPAFDSDAVRELLQQARSASYVQQLHALRQVSCMLEKEEAAFRQLVGDPFATPNQRAGFTIGKLLAVVKVGCVAGCASALVFDIYIWQAWHMALAFAQYTTCPGNRRAVAACRGACITLDLS